MKFEFKEHTDKGLVREVNEDNMGHSLNSKNGDVFVVCDGMGGHVGGQTASTIGVNALLSELTSKAHNNMHVAISQALTFANEQVLGHAEADPSLKGMGSTATVCLFKDDLLYLGHVGDSRAYIYSDKKLYRITRDDSYVQELVDKGVITEDEAEMHPNKNRILQALGSTGSITPRIPKKPFKLKTGDLLLLCSDGLTSMVVDELIEQLINPQDLGGTLQELHKIAMTNGGKDNITMTLIKITESPYLQNDFDHFTVKYNTKKTSPKHNITGTPPPIDISAPAKKKVPMSYILGAATILLLIVAGYFFMQGSGENEQSKIDKTKTVDFSVIEKLVDDSQSDSLKYYVGFTVTGDIDTKSNLGDYMISENNEFVLKPNAEGTGETFTTQTKPEKKKPVATTDPLKKEQDAVDVAKSALQKLVDKYNKKGSKLEEDSNDCSNCQEEDLTTCNEKMQEARQKYNGAVQDLEKARKRINKQ
ncbi:MAG: Stp1/IreP family PP2C-type Ser/Thr phosphatase [Flavobacteriales bacterium]